MSSQFTSRFYLTRVAKPWQQGPQCIYNKEKK